MAVQADALPSSVEFQLSAGLFPSCFTSHSNSCIWPGKADVSDPCPWEHAPVCEIWKNLQNLALDLHFSGLSGSLEE